MKKFLYIFTTLLLYISCGNKTKETPIEENSNENEITITRQQFMDAGMKTVTLSEQNFQETIRVNGYIDVPPQNRASVRTFIGGYVKHTPLLVGDKVKKGQPLITLENTEYVAIQQEFSEISQKITFLKAEYGRQKKLYEENITSQKNYLKAESEYKSTLAMYNGLKRKLEMMNINPENAENGNIVSSITIYAPIAGSISKINTSTGAFVSPADEIMEIINPEHIHLELSVFEKDIMKIKVGQPVYFKVPEASDEVFEAEVHLVGASVSENNRTVKIHGHLKNEDHTFVTGMFTEADIVVNEYKSLALPANAVAEWEGADYVLVLKNKNDDEYTFEKKPVNIKSQTEDYVAIDAQHIKPTDEILSKGAFNLINE
ncbi:efflux RND transporter periplasmic adaptor subunit [Abyssalbus ytuae]|uniref:Efflux RND transporter periplasmic adaptor subunit n=1 Tax=Abyssalbus ytuae TaxID=2926907 RepID=A0A9E7D4N3_9FLAO|nr:efflux RND transporter periplasmic adaptor subunit [Abyssalbus ytuae]UOB19119.1 efflux RND transporter periplasmic adaptor subunit [Abyssalbus ytuae]